MVDPMNAAIQGILTPLIGGLMFVINFIIHNILWILLGAAWVYFGYYIWKAFKEEKENEERENNYIDTTEDAKRVEEV